MNRFRFSYGPALLHFIASLVFLSIFAFFLFSFWFPGGYASLSGGGDVFFIFAVVDAISGSLMTFIVFSPVKSRSQLRFDLACILMVQIFAMGYGVYSMALSRPLVLAFEKDRFRVVSESDIPKGLRVFNWENLSYLHPTLVGVRVAQPGDSDYLSSVRLSLSGIFPSYRPESWVDYSAVRSEVLTSSKPLRLLLSQYPAAKKEILKFSKNEESELDSFGYSPLSSYRYDDWVVVVDMRSGQPAGFLHLSPWF